MSIITSRNEFAYDKNLGYKYIPNVTARFSIGGREGYLHKTNTQGYRSDFDFEIKKIKSKRLVFVGDSHCAGTGVSNSSRFSDVIQSHFDYLECYNFGLSGSGFVEQLLIYENEIKDYEHDILFLCPFISNISRYGKTRRVFDKFSGKIINSPKPDVIISEGEIKFVNLPVPRPEPMFVNNSSSDSIREVIKSSIKSKIFADLVYLDSLPLVIKEVLLKFKHSKAWDYNKKNLSWLLTQKIIESFIDKVDGRHLVLCPLPFPKILNFPSYESLFLPFSKKHENVHYIDIMKNLRNLKREERWKLTYARDKHHTEQGHKFLAKIIIDFLSEEIYNG